MSVPQIRAITYLCPSVPVELFQTVLDLLEEQTGYHATLQYEWRSDGPLDSRPDPFQSNLIDLAFIPSSGYINLESRRNEFAELLPVTPIFKHPKNEGDVVGTFIDIVVHADKLKHNVSGVADLRGCRWACSRENSLAHYVTVKMLAELGENQTFFGTSHSTASHLEAVNMVLNKKVEAAAIDAAALVCNKNQLHNGAKDVVTLASYGPFAPYAIVINSRIEPQLRQQFIRAFQTMSGDPRFQPFGLLKFSDNRPDLYDVEKKLINNVSSKLGKVPYY